MKKNFTKKDEVIELLKAGWEIYTDRTEHRGKRGQTVYASLRYVISPPTNGDDRYVHSSTISSLIENGIIHPPGDGHDKYKLVTVL